LLNYPPLACPDSADRYNPAPNNPSKIEQINKLTVKDPNKTFQSPRKLIAAWNCYNSNNPFMSMFNKFIYCLHVHPLVSTMGISGQSEEEELF
jgi:hypothetical protein